MGIRNILFDVLVRGQKARTELKKTADSFEKTGGTAQKAAKGTLQYEEATNRAAAQSTKLNTTLKRTDRDVNSVRNQLKRARLEMNATAKSGGGLQAIIGKLGIAFGAIQAIQLGRQSIDDFNVQAEAEERLLVSLKGREDVQSRLIKQASELQAKTQFGDEVTIEAQSLLATQLGGNADAVERLIPLVQDLAVQEFKGNLVSAATLVGKSVGSSMNALSRYGIAIEGNVGSVERLDSAVAALSKRYKGQAEAQAAVGSGDITQTLNIIGDAREELGRLLTELIGEYTPGIKGAAVAMGEFFKNVDIDKVKRLLSVVALLTKTFLTFKLVQIAVRATFVATNAAMIIARTATLAYAIAKNILTGNTVRAAAAMRLFTAATASNPLGLLLVTLIAVAPLLVSFVRDLGKAKKEVAELSQTTKSLNKVTEEYNKNAAQEIAEVSALFAALKKTNPKSQERKDLIDKINSTYGTTLQNLSDENKFIGQLNSSYDALVANLKRKIALDLQQQELTDLIVKERAKRAEVESLSEFVDDRRFNTPIKDARDFVFEKAKDDLQKAYDDLQGIIAAEEALLSDEFLNGLIGDVSSATPVVTTGGGGAAEAKAKKLMEGTIAAYKAEIGALNKKREEQLQLFANGLINLEEFKNVTQEIESKREALDKALAAISPVEPYKAQNESIAEIKKEIRSIEEAITETEARGFLTPELQTRLEEAKVKLKETYAQLRQATVLAQLELEEEETRHKQELLRIQGEQNDETEEQKRATNNRIIDLEVELLSEQLRLRKEAGVLTYAEEEKLQNRLEELKLSKASKTNEKLKEEQKKFNDERNDSELDAKLDLITRVTTAVFDLAQTLTDIQLRQLENLTTLQEQRVQEALTLAEDGNTTLLEKEQERLDELNRKRAQYVRTQQALAAIEVAANAAVAIAKAAAEGGVAAPFTIAATLISLAAGLAQARALSSQAAFKDGVIDFQGKGTGRSDSNVVRISHGESVITAHGTDKAPRLLEAINRGEISDSIFGRLLTGRNMKVLQTKESGGRQQTPQELKEMLALMKKQSSTSTVWTQSGIVKTINKAKQGTRRILTRI